jgi:hypothetical protein
MKNFSFKFGFLRKTLAVWVVLFAFASFASAQTTQTSPAPKTFEISDDGVPVLIKNLPDWEKAQSRAALASNLQDLQKAAGERPILSVIDFAGGTEAVTAPYDKARLVIVEFHTPQMAVEMDAKIQARLAELNLPLTNTAYRKEGNYAVFVFDASDEQTANALLDRVDYSKQVQWLGGNPYPGIEAARKEREYIQTAGGVFVAVLQSAGIAVTLALTFGGLLGIAVFFIRRKQQAGQNAYSDAGGMVRLNLDEMTPQINPNRLIENK